MSILNSKLSLLKGVKIIDTTVNLPGPAAGMILGLLGAEIIKVEPPAGDPVSMSPALYNTINQVKEHHSYDLRNNEDYGRVMDLIKESDGILVGMREAALTKLGLDYECLKRINPHLIYCHVAGYPKDSEKKHAPGHDLTYLAELGLLRTFFSDVTKVTTQLGDMTAALYTVIAFLSALNHRYVSGNATSIEINIFESPLILGLIPQHDQELTKELQGESICYRVYQTKDGWIALGALEQKFFTAFTKAIGHPEWKDFGKKRATPGDEIYEAIKEIIHRQTTNYWTELGKQLDIPIEAVNPLKQNEGFSLPYRI